MITLPANFQAENDKKENTPSILVYLEDSELKAEKTSAADWGNNVSENQVDYSVSPGNVKLSVPPPIWLCSGLSSSIYDSKIYNVDTDGTIISSFLCSVFETTTFYQPRGITYAIDRTLWVTNNYTNKIFNIQTDGTLISSFSTSVFDPSSTTITGISYAADGTLWVCDIDIDKVYNIQTDGTLITSFSTSVFDAAATSITGVSYAADGTLWVCDFDSEKIYNITTSGSLISSFPCSTYDVSATGPYGVSYSNYDKTLWITDVVTDKIYNVQTDGTPISSFATSAFDSDASFPAGISFAFTYYPTGNITTDNIDLGATPTVNGEWQLGDTKSESNYGLWACDDSDVIYKITLDGETESVFDITGFDSGAVDNRGIAYDTVTHTLWIIDSTTDTIYNVDLDGDLISSFSVTDFDSGAATIQGIVVAPDGTLWLCDNTSDKIYNVQTDGTLISSFATSVFDVSATDPQGITYDTSDDTLWVVDDNTDKIYNIQTDGSLIKTIIFDDFDSALTSSGDITYSGFDDTLYINGRSSDKIYNISKSGTLISTITLDSGFNVWGIVYAPGNTLLYEAWGSDTGAFSGEEISLGYVVDGDEITDLHRYYRVDAKFIASIDSYETPVLQSIAASFVTFTKLTDTKGLGLNVTVSSVSSLTTKIDFFKESTIGKVSIEAFFNQEMSAYFSTQRKNRLAKIYHGFNGLTTSDYINYYYGVIGNHSIDTDEKITIDIDDYTATWEKPVPEKWESIADDVEWVATHPVDVIRDILQIYLDVRDSFILYDELQAVKEATPGWVVSRTITNETISAKTLLDELRRLLSAFFIPKPNGKIGIKRFDSTEAAVVSISDADFIREPGLSYDAQYAELRNHIITYYGWDGSSNDLDAYTAIDDYSNATSIADWKEEVYEVIKDKWTLSTGTSQVEDRRDILDSVYSDAPVLLSGKVSRRLLYLEVGDIVSITIDRYPNASGFGITDKNFLLVRKNYNYENSYIDVSFLEI